MAAQTLEILHVEPFVSKKGNTFPQAQCILRGEDGSIKVCTHMQFTNTELIPMDLRGVFEVEWGCDVNYENKLGAIIKSLKPVTAQSASSVKSAPAAAAAK